MSQPSTQEAAATVALEDTDYLVWQTEQCLRRLQDRIVDACDKTTLQRLVARLSSETVQ